MRPLDVTAGLHHAASSSISGSEETGRQPAATDVVVGDVGEPDPDRFGDAVDLDEIMTANAIFMPMGSQVALWRIFIRGLRIKQDWR